MNELTHFDDAGRARMVDVGDKSETHRIAIASARITMQPETLETIIAGTASKGDVLGVAQVSAIMGAKKTSDLVPMCHPLSPDLGQCRSRPEPRRLGGRHHRAG